MNKAGYLCTVIAVIATILLPVLAKETTNMTTANCLLAFIEQIRDGKLEIVDLSHALNASTPLFDEREPQMVYRTVANYEHDGYRAGQFEMLEHFGTHIDAPAHFVSGAPTVDQIAPANLILPAVVIDVRAQVEKDPDYRLTKETIVEFEKRASVAKGAAVLLLTGWASRYNDAKRYRNCDKAGDSHFPGFGVEAAKYLVEEKGVSALGIDTLSIDYGLSKDFQVHKIALGHDLFMIENLDKLESLPSSGAIIFCAPLKLEGGSGSPSRILAIKPKP